jgi:malonyl-CoA/methylmalonyl-CoA synthetase
MFERSRARGPLRDALIFEGQRWSWQALHEHAARLAHHMSVQGVAQGDRVVLWVSNRPEFILSLLACLQCGAIAVPVSVREQGPGLAFILAQCAARAVVYDDALADRLPSVNDAPDLTLRLGADAVRKICEGTGPQHDTAPSVSEEDTAAILYTSGTTGRSKGAMLSHANLASNAQVLDHYWRWRRGDVLLHALPIFHVHGLFVASHGALLSGSKMIWLPRFDPKEVVRHLPRATVFMGVPTMYVRLLDEPAFTAEAARGMRLFVSGSAPLLTDTFRQFEARTGQRILERYGMSETVMLTSNPYDGNRVGGTVGLPLPGVSVRIVDDAGRALAAPEIGGVEVRGPNVFSGYWRMPEKTKEEFTADGWFRTGDVGRWDANGYLTIVGRSKDLIITGGYNVYPKEIESYLDDMDGVAESAVIGVPHRDFGEAVTAVVVRKPGAVLDEEAIVASLKTRIAGFKVPKRVHVVDELPRNAMGKVQKNELRKRYAAT